MDAIFDVTLSPSGKECKNWQRLNDPPVYVPGGRFDVAFCLERDCTPWYGDCWINMLFGMVDTLFGYDVTSNPYISDFDVPYYNFDGYPGFLYDRQTVTDSLLPDMADLDTRLFHYFGHGSPTILGSTNSPNDPHIYLNDIQSALGNKYSVWDGIYLPHPYRFVILDACSSAKTASWRKAFGIRKRLDDSNVGRTGAQAFLGWPDFAAIPGPGNTDEWNQWGDTLQGFYANWMQGYTVDNCINIANDADPYSNPWPLDEETKRPLKFYGYPGIRIDGFDSGYPYKSSYYQVK